MTNEEIKKVARRKKTNQEKLLELEIEKEKIAKKESDLKKKIAAERKKEIMKKQSVVYDALEEGLVGFDSLDFEETEYIVRQIVEKHKEDIEKEIKSI